MNLREILQIEIFSKSTSRRVFVGIGIVFGLVYVGNAALSVVGHHWLTPRERTAARTALSQIDQLENLVRSSDQDFSAKAKMVQQSVDFADNAARTARDRYVVSELMTYRLVPVIDRYRFKTQKPIQHQLDEKLNSLGVKSSRMELHKELD
jgi:hypothetical protein